MISARPCSARPSRSRSAIGVTSSAAHRSTAFGFSGASIGSRMRLCIAPSTVSTFVPSARSSGEPVTWALKISGCVLTYWTSAQRVTNHSPTAGTQQTGKSRRIRA